MTSRGVDCSRVRDYELSESKREADEDAPVYYELSLVEVKENYTRKTYTVAGHLANEEEAKWIGGRILEATKQASS